MGYHVASRSGKPARNEGVDPQTIVQQRMARHLPAWEDLTDPVLIRLYVEREWSMRQIARCYGFAESSIRKRILRLGVTPRPRWEKGGTPRVYVDLGEAVEALRRGRRIEEVADCQGVSPMTLRRRLAEAGLIAARRSGYDRGQEVAS